MEVELIDTLNEGPPLVRGDSPQEIPMNLPIRQTTVHDYRHNLLRLGTVAPPLCVMGTPPKPTAAARETLFDFVIEP